MRVGAQGSASRALVYSGQPWPGTELNFALVPYHPAGQAPGLGRVHRVRHGWATREGIPELLDLHRQIIAAG
jgi:hypothetical protein